MLGSEYFLNTVQGGNGVIKPWISDTPARLCLYKWRLQPFSIAIVSFVIYWFLPLFANFLQGTLVSEDMRLIAVAKAPPLNGIFALSLSPQLIKDTTVVPYLSDMTHLGFTVNVSVAVFIGTVVLRLIDNLLYALASSGVIPSTKSHVGEYADVYESHRRAANHPIAKVVALILASLAILSASRLALDSQFSAWWGNIIYGYAGLFILFIDGIVVYLGMRAFVLLSTASLMIARLMGKPFILRPFHPDGCNGLSHLGRIIMCLWIMALNISVAIGLPIYLGYFGVEKYFSVWLLALVGTVTIPLIAIVPLWRTVNSLQRLRMTQLALYEPTLMEKLRSLVSADCASISRKCATDTPLSELKVVYDVYMDMNVWPFNPRAIVIVSVAYCVQLVLTMRELFFA